jgi:hypothetical protein
VPGTEAPGLGVLQRHLNYASARWESGSEGVKVQKEMLLGSAGRKLPVMQVRWMTGLDRGSKVIELDQLPAVGEEIVLEDSGKSYRYRVTDVHLPGSEDNRRADPLMVLEPISRT